MFTKYKVHESDIPYADIYLLLCGSRLTAGLPFRVDVQAIASLAMVLCTGCVLLCGLVTPFVMLRKFFLPKSGRGSTVLLSVLS